jgi:electron transport complex protein RnfC
MKLNTVASLIVGAFGLVSATAYAQNPAPDRAAVKKETAEAVKKGEIAKGEAGAPAAKSTGKSDVDRKKVKAETAAAEKKGETPRAGESTAGAAAPKAEAKSDTKRADVKAATAQAVKKGDIPKGEAGPKQ